MNSFNSIDSSVAISRGRTPNIGSHTRNCLIRPEAHQRLIRATAASYRLRREALIEAACSCRDTELDGNMPPFQTIRRTLVYWDTVTMTCDNRQMQSSQQGSLNRRIAHVSRLELRQGVQGDGQNLRRKNDSQKRINGGNPTHPFKNKSVE